MILKSSLSGRETQTIEVLQHAKKKKKCFLVLHLSFYILFLTLIKEQCIMLSIRGFTQWLLQNLVWYWSNYIGTDILIAKGRTEVIYFQTKNFFWLFSIDKALHCYFHSLYLIFPSANTLGKAWEPELSCLLASMVWFLLLCFVLNV